MAVRAPDLFSHTVPQAEDAFAAACDDLGLAIRVHACPERGVHGEQLHTTVTRVGPRPARNVVLVISGTHGIEGYAGCAIQTGFLREAADLVLPDDTAVVLVHSINPWGLAWNRRESEANIDLFRNFLYADEPSPTDPLYHVIEENLNYRQWSGPGRDAADAALDDAVRAHGVLPLHWAIRRGQHDYPRGMSFHGDGVCWATRVLRGVVDEECAGAERVAVVDVHTGFGPGGHGTCIVYSPTDSAATQRLASWHGELYLPSDDPAIPTHSTLLPYAWIEDRVPGSATTMVSLEFGTFDNSAIFWTMRDSSHLHNYGDLAAPHAADTNAEYRRFFYPETDDWMTSVWQRGRQVLAQTITGIAAWGRDG